MATVYIKPSTGTGTGTLADPYFYSQLATAETAAGSGGTILFTDGSYSSLGSQTWDASGVTYKSLNKQGASIDGDVADGGAGPLARDGGGACVAVVVRVLCRAAVGIVLVETTAVL